jgi:hypothetical protein
MKDAIKGPPGLQECWEGFRHLLLMIETLFGGLFDAPAYVRRADAESALCWLRDAESAARALLLAMAQAMTVVLAPLRKHMRAERAHAPPQSRFALLTRIARRGHSCAPSARALAARADRRAEDGFQWRMFGRRRDRACVIDSDAPPFWRGEPMAHDTTRAWGTRLDDIVDRRVLARRFNGLVRVLHTPDPYARRLARHLARDRAQATARALARRSRHRHAQRPPQDAFVRRCASLALPRGADDG